MNFAVIQLKSLDNKVAAEAIRRKKSPSRGLPG
jgi:hypothetical protein